MADGWQVVDSPAPAFKADQAALAPVLATFAHLQAARFVSFGGKPDLGTYGLDKPAATIQVTLQPAGGKAEEHTLLLGKTIDPKSTERFARVDQGGVFVLPEAVWQPLLRDYLAYVDPGLLNVEPAKVSSISRSMNGETVEFLRKDSGWEVKAKTTNRGDGPTLNNLADELAKLHAIRIASYPAKDPAAFGLEKPEAVFTLHATGADGKPANPVIQIGKSAGEGPAKGERFVRVEKGPAIGVLSADAAGKLLAPALEYRDRNLANISSVDRATLERGSRKAVFESTDGAWKMTLPVAAPAEQTDLQEFVAAVSHLRADRLVADKPTDLKAYGLDKPSEKWIFQSAGKNALELLIGKPAEGGKAYAKFAGSNLVFLLDPGITKQAEAEYRARTVWPAPLDAVQIDRVQITGEQGPYTLEKIDNVWKLAGKSDSALNQDAVKELLDALAGLKALQFAADKTGDFKLFGLDPAQRTIEVQTPSGKRTLGIGRPEGESRLRYARVPEGEAAQAVFVISAEEASKLLKPSSAYLQAKPATK